MIIDPVLQQLEAHVASLGLAEGDRLPSERALAAELQLSRRTLREALTKLELADRVWRGVGQGTFLGPKPATTRDSLAEAVASSDPVSIIEARLALEPALAALAALKWKPADLEAIETSVSRNAETRDPESWGRWDSVFHRAVAAAGQNPLLVALFDQLESARERAAWGKLRAVIATEERRRISVAQHRLIAEAIADRDPEAAHHAMWSHLQAVSQAMQSIRPGAGGPAGRRAAADVLDHA